MTTPSRATPSSSWRAQTGASSANIKSQPAAKPTSSDLAALELDLSVQLELRAQLQEEPSTDVDEANLVETNNKICDIVKEIDRVRGLLGLAMDDDFWGSADGSLSSAGTLTAQQQVRQQGNQLRQQQTQRGQQPQQPQPQQDHVQQQHLPVQQRQQDPQQHGQGQGQGQQPFQQLGQQRGSLLNNSEDFQNSFSEFVPRERKRSIGTSLGHDASEDSGSRSKRMATGTGSSNQATFSDSFNADLPAGSNIDFGFDLNDLDDFDDFFDDFNSSGVIDLTG